MGFLTIKTNDEDEIEFIEDGFSKRDFIIVSVTYDEKGAWYPVFVKDLMAFIFCVTKTSPTLGIFFSPILAIHPIHSKRGIIKIIEEILTENTSALVLACNTILVYVTKVFSRVTPYDSD